MTHAEIIDSLGGTAALARTLERNESTVANWKERGIPWRWRPEIARLAKAGKVMLPADFLVAL